MRNLPDDELYDALEKRLGNYSEPPDDEVWIKIAGALSPSREPGWIVWTNRMAIFFLLATPLLFLMNDDVSKYETLRTLNGVENSVTEPNGTKSTLRSTETPELGPDPIKENDVRETEKLVASGHRVNKRLTRKPPLAENRSVIMEDPVALSESPSVKKEDLSNKSNIDSISDTFQVIMKINADSVRVLIQTDSSKKEQRKKSRIAVYMLLTPSLSFHHVSPISNDDVVIEKLNSPAVLSMDRLGISVEAGIQGKISKRFQYIAGVSFYHQSQRIQYEQQSADNVVIESGEGMSYAVSPGTLQNAFHYNMTNIGIQTGLLYTLKEHGLVHKAGIVFHYQKGLQHGGQDVAYNNASSNYLHYQLFYRIEYTINPKMSLVIQPGYTHSVIANESLQAPFRLKQSRAGIGIGIVYSF